MQTTPLRMARFPWLALLLLAPAFQATAADGPAGEQTYRKKCASCHGAAGEGTKEHYPRPLAGSRSVAQLARVIGKTMPEDAPGTLSADEAGQVAAYVYDAFYSAAARECNKPPRVELARLTVGQYQNAVADLLTSFRASGKWDEQRGLKGEYFKSRRFRNDQRALERLDPEVCFDFGTASPDPAKLDAHEFSIRWEGSVLAPETGSYEFIVRTEHAVRLWVNDPNQPLIDALVKSANDKEHRGSLFLLAGRAYPLRLEFAKATQGVNNQKKGGDKPLVPASIWLGWKPPSGMPEPVPARYLSPNRAPEAFVVSTAFPPDDRSLGWERATTISQEWDQATTDAALEAAGYVAAHLDELAGLRARGRDPGPGSGDPADINLDAPAGPKPAADRPEKLREFARRFVERAFRRPLTDEEKRAFLDRPFQASADPDVAVKRVVLFTLKSPRFLYREVGGGPDGYDVASRLAFGLWDAPPDQELLDAAAAGNLSTRDQVARQAERMLADPRAHAKLRQFFLQWLRVDRALDLSKDSARFPGFDAAVVADLRTSLELFLDDVAWGDDPDFRRLFRADQLFLNDRLATYYGADLPAAAAFRKVKLGEEPRAGVLTHPYLMAAFAYTGATSPIHRGVFVARGVLGLTLRPPPEAFAPLAEDLHPGLTTRERVSLQTKPGSCQACHGVINPLGFTLEHFDAVGRYRDRDNGKPVDAAGSYQTAAGEAVKFTGVRDLAEFLGNSEEVHVAFTEQLFHHLVKQPVRAYGPRQQDDLRESFARNGFNIRKLAVEIVTVSALAGQKPQPAPAPADRPRQPDD